jgi:hypothetical protein
MARDTSGGAHQVLRPFATYLQKHLLIPSATSDPGTNTSPRTRHGCFTYQPDHAVAWGHPRL